MNFFLFFSFEDDNNDYYNKRHFSTWHKGTLHNRIILHKKIFIDDTKLRTSESNNTMHLIDLQMELGITKSG